MVFFFLLTFSVHGKIAWDGPKWGREGFFLANPDLADILGNTDFDFENFVFFSFFFLDPNFQISRSQISKFPEIWPRPGLGPAWARAWARAWTILAASLVRMISFKFRMIILIILIQAGPCQTFAAWPGV